MRLNPLSCLKEYQYHLITGCKSALLWLWIGATVMTFQPQFNTRSEVSLSLSFSFSFSLCHHTLIHFLRNPFLFLCADTLRRLSNLFRLLRGYRIWNWLVQKKKKNETSIHRGVLPIQGWFHFIRFQGLSVCLHVKDVSCVCVCVCVSVRARCFVLLPFSQLYICHTISHTRLYLTYA